MGATPEDTKREIDGLRDDMTAAIDELERRLRGGLSSVQSGEVLSVAESTAADKPTLLGVVGVVAVAAVGYGVYAGISRWRASRTPEGRIKRTVRGVRHDIEEKLEGPRKQLEEARKRGVLLKLEPADSGYTRLVDAKLDALPDKNKGRKDMIKKLIWAGLLSIFMAVSSVLARRAAGGVWRATVREDPPTEKSAARK
jgi:hypothetical protein